MLIISLTINFVVKIADLPVILMPVPWPDYRVKLKNTGISGSWIVSSPLHSLTVLDLESAIGARDNYWI